ncbi:MAG: DUF3300 domain-containing protein [Betaproteobacteria bacterium]|nr:DUF3300 domain-containing protein [Betaproteobacteria bacterium]
MPSTDDGPAAFLAFGATDAGGACSGRERLCRFARPDIRALSSIPPRPPANPTMILRLRAFFAALVCLVSGVAAAQADFRPFGKEQIDQLTAQIALFPDALLSQVLMAATYPKDVAEASAWARANPDEKGDAAVSLVQDKPWDPSVQSLVAFPQVVVMMGENPTWVKDLGDAFLLQPEDVMDSVQRLQPRGAERGNLQSNEQVVVKVETQPPPDIVVQVNAPPPPPQVIVIEQRSPEVTSCRCTTRSTCSGRGWAGVPAGVDPAAGLLVVVALACRGRHLVGRGHRRHARCLGSRQLVGPQRQHQRPSPQQHPHQQPDRSPRPQHDLGARHEPPTRRSVPRRRRDAPAAGRPRGARRPRAVARPRGRSGARRAGAARPRRDDRPRGVARREPRRPAAAGAGHRRRQSRPAAGRRSRRGTRSRATGGPRGSPRTDGRRAGAAGAGGAGAARRLQGRRAIARSRSIALRRPTERGTSTARPRAIVSNRPTGVRSRIGRATRSASPRCRVQAIAMRASRSIAATRAANPRSARCRRASLSRPSVRRSRSARRTPARAGRSRSRRGMPLPTVRSSGRRAARGRPGKERRT